MKIDRQAVFAKCGGKCAYCGQDITIKSFQVDHVNPQFRGGSDDMDNLLPSCRKCNNHKSAYPLDSKYGRHLGWRGQLELQVERLRKSAQFDRALRFGQIQITESPIVFYFERKTQ